MKEKIGIEKLIKLLNEYGNERYDYWGDYQTFMDFSDRDIYWYLSKKFGFIKWLVENDKIDLEKERNKEFKRIDFDLAEGMDGYEITTEDVFLMWLSIQDEPIRFLCEIIK